MGRKNKYGVSLVLEKRDARTGKREDVWIGGGYFPMLKRKIREAEKESMKPNGKILVVVSEADIERERAKMRKVA